MLSWLRYVHVVRRVDKLCFKKRTTLVIPKLFGRPAYEGWPPRIAVFSAPVFFNYERIGFVPLAIHEVRHKAQWHNPKMRLLGVQDIPPEFIEELMPYFLQPGLTPREIDAEIVEHIALPLLFKGQISSFIELMLGETEER